ncbi:LacI family DNA-binding transcriptional regulator [uncultured Devosia sp.]|uniref:LacI family DNA-binding transcriptional regulator n=1 Tax=uncultured Devosia sp. TaxID=211434 RepID=UPI00262BA06A|nr:LacI family DNA-binding transcriptional regulator [uncultured Devosia sp.]
MARVIRPSISDVARRAGVSTATVSHVYNGTRFVAEPTRQRVMAAAAELSYRPNLVAGAMRSKRTRAVGAVLALPGAEPFATTIMQGVEFALAEAGISLLFSDSRNDPDRELEAIAMLESRLVDGLVLLPATGGGSYYERMVERGRSSAGRPIVLIDAQVEGCSSVSSDLYTPTLEAMEQLIAKGHRRIALLRNDKDVTVSRAKLAGYHDALRRHGMDSDRWVFAGGMTLADGARLMHEILDQGEATAVIIANHIMMLGALPVLRTRGVSVPDELAILGFEEYPWMGAVLPSISVITQDPYAIGVEAARVILELGGARSGGPPIVRTVPTSFVDRGSL